jgi:hypothetical protein
MDKHMSADNSQALMDITQNTIYLMGASFVLGSLFTLFLLLVLDFIRRNKTDKPY